MWSWSTGRVRAIVVAGLAASVCAAPSKSIAAHLDCGQPFTNGTKPVASDCLFILRASIGNETCTPECICDTDGNSSTSASDALRCLLVAVSNPNGTLACDCPSWKVTWPDAAT